MQRVRRLIIAAGILVVASVALGASAGRHPKAVEGARSSGQLREFTLVAEPVRWEIQPGLVVDGWGYNGQTPGPLIRVTEGDLVRVTLINRLPVATTIHWHGIDVPLAMDGVPSLSQPQVEPGESFVYEFIATNPGTRMYHSHVDSDAQIQLGLVGPLIVDPRMPEPVRYDREFTYLLMEKALDFTPEVALGQADIRHRDAGNGRGGAMQYDLFLMNGKAASAIEPMAIAPGERVRVRLINMGNLPHAMHLHGHSFRIIATDGNPVPPAAQLLKDTVLIGPAERYDLEVEGTNPGIWMFHCHMNNHGANGMMTVLHYDGAEPVAGGEHTGAHGHGRTGAMPAPAPGPMPPSAVPASPAATATAVQTPAHGARPNAAEAEIVALDNRFQPTTVTVPAGMTLRWVNRGSNAHTISSADGIWDSGTLLHGESFSVVLSEPGTYRYLCRQHVLQGMGGSIIVTPP